MLRKTHPNLDLLESPLISANPFGTLLAGIPGSAIAEKIFNDPQSWHGSDEGDLASDITKDPMAWLEEELEKFQKGDSPTIERGPEAVLKPFSERYKVTAKPSLVLPNINEVHANWVGVQQEETHPNLPRLELTSPDLNGRLSRILETGGNIFRSFPSPVTSTSPPPSPSHNKPKITTSPSIRPGVSFLNLAVGEPSPVVSPVVITSTSTTWSILELYGAPPTPRLDSGHSDSSDSYPTTPVPPVPPLPTYKRHASPCNTTPLPPAPSINTSVKEHTLPHGTSPIRRLPVIPNLSRRKVSPHSKPSLVKAKTTIPAARDQSPPPSMLLRSHSDRSYSSPIAHPSPRHNRTPSSASRSPPAGPRARCDIPSKARCGPKF